MNPIESLHVDGQWQELSRLAVPEMSLSSARSEMQRHSFVLKIRGPALIEFLEAPYATWVAESRRDDELTGSPHDDLAAAGYPSLRELLNMPKLLELVLGHYLRDEFLRKLSWDGVGPIEQWLDEITDCRVDENVVYLSGLCFSKVEDEAEQVIPADASRRR